MESWKDRKEYIAKADETGWAQWLVAIPESLPPDKYDTVAKIALNHDGSLLEFVNPERCTNYTELAEIAVKNPSMRFLRWMITLCAVATGVST